MWNLACWTVRVGCERVRDEEQGPEDSHGLRRCSCWRHGECISLWMVRREFCIATCSYSSSKMEGNNSPEGTDSWTGLQVIMNYSPHCGQTFLPAECSWHWSWSPQCSGSAWRPALHSREVEEGKHLRAGSSISTPTCTGQSRCS